MAWEVEVTDEFVEWWDSLTEDEQERVTAVVTQLEASGPALPRPLADTIRGSRHRNIKELIPPASTIRVLFAFDPRRVAILLIGGDKAGRWNEWYEEFVPVADRLYDEHLEEIAREEAEGRG